MYLDKNKTLRNLLSLEMLEPQILNKANIYLKIHFKKWKTYLENLIRRMLN